MDTFLQDIRVALRSFRRSPGFSLTATITLALGIGATTAIFTTLSAVLLTPLPYPHAQDLYSLRTALTDGRVTTGLLSGAEIYRLNDSSLSIQGAAGFTSADLTLLADDGTPSNVQVALVTEGFFKLFGLPMVAGGFTHNDFAPIQPGGPGAPPPANALPRIVISSRLWKTFFHGDTGIVGKPIHFAELTTTIAGVAPEGFDIPHNGDLWAAQRVPVDDPNHGREGFIRLRPGTSIGQAKSQMATVAAGLGRDYPAADRNRIYVTRPLVDSIVGDLGPILIIVMSATGLLLLLACVNVANLLLARGAVRARELAVRAALGAGWTRLVRQLFTESFLLAAAGTVLGVAVGALGLHALLALGASKLPRLDAVHFDGRVGLFALIILFITTGIIGLAPAIRLWRSDLKALMDASSRSTSAGRGTARWLMAMTVAEVALAIMLVAGAGWLVRGFANLRSTNPGFQTANRLVFDVSFLGPKFQTPAAVAQAQRDLMSAIEGIRGVKDAGLVSVYPMRGRLEASLLARFHGEPFDPNNAAGTRQRFSSPGLFAAMGTPLLQGRDFTDADVQGSERVAIVNKVFVDKYLHGRNPIGVQFSAGYPVPDPNNEVTIVGVIADVRQKSLDLPGEPSYYVPLAQVPAQRATAVVAMSRANAATVELAIRNAVRQINPAMAVDFELASDVLGGTIRRQELGMTLMLVFGGIAIVLAAVGIYGVISYAGSLRMDEMATRLALGASPRDVWMLVMKQGVLLGVTGAAIGIVLAYVSGRIVRNEVYAIQAFDPLMLALATLLIAAITFLATTIPAARAARLNPADALRTE